MMAAAYFTIFLAGALFTLSAQAVLAMWRNPTPPDGCHVVIRKGKRFVRRNPKPKQLVEVPNE
jgi:hypothetical protein